MPPIRRGFRTRYAAEGRTAHLIALMQPAGGNGFSWTGKHSLKCAWPTGRKLGPARVNRLAASDNGAFLPLSYSEPMVLPVSIPAF